MYRSSDEYDRMSKLAMIILSAEDIDVIMKSVGAISVDNNNEKIYKREDGYYRLSLVQGLGGYVIEYAETEEHMVMASGLAVGYSPYDWYLPEYAGINEIP